MATRKKTTKKTSASSRDTGRIVLLDSHAIIHRAYHALPELTSPAGEPTGALYGLSSMLIRIIQDLTPDYVVVCYDLPELTHRHEVYEDYKGTRAKTDDALVAQLERAKEVYEAFNIPAYAAKGFEADDVIGTLATRLRDETDLEIIIASGDHDTLQLVDEERVKVYTLRKGLSDTVLFDEAAVREKYGFASDLIPDYKGLRGDPSDNIKGIAGIGEKTATELITAFGSIEQIYETLRSYPERFAAAGIKPRIVTLLTEGEDDAAFSKQLGAIKLDVPLDFQLPEQSWMDAVEPARVLTLFDELGFRSLADRFRALVGVQGEAAAETDIADAAAADPQLAAEASVALWLLHSDMTNPSAEDVLRYTRAPSLTEAHGLVMKELRETGRLFEVFERIEQPLIPIVAGMQRDGIRLQVGQLEALSKQLHTELDAISKRIFAAAGHEFNLNSPRQLGVVLFDELGLSIARHKKTAGGQRSTRESELEKLAEEHEIVRDILAYREVQKLVSTYVDTLPKLVGEDGRLHAQFLQAGTTTGRMASQNPNLQNIPVRTDAGRAIRGAFQAADGWQLVALDYSQIELRIAAGLSGDEKLIGVFQQGGDVHTAVAAEVFGVPPEHVDTEMRRRAKVINFGILYGMGVNALRTNLGDGVGRDEAGKYLADYFKNFAGIARYVEKTKADAALHGFTETLFGRRRYFSGFDSPLPYVRASAERMAINAPIQGTQADIIKLAMVRVVEQLQQRGWTDDARLLLQVHDELIYEVKKEQVQEIALLIKHEMESIMTPDDLGGVPIVTSISVGDSWGSLASLAPQT